MDGIKTIRDIDLTGKRVLLRADYNVPIDEKGHISDGYRIMESLPTVQYLLERKAKVIICSHLGRPDGKKAPSLSLAPVAKYLSKELKRPVEFIDDCIGPKVEKAAKSLRSGQILMLENLRFYPEEEENDNSFAAKLASLADVFVQDAFGVIHRAHASTDAITKLLPSVAGLLLEKEITTIESVMHDPKHPLIAIIGGAKIADKIDILNRFIDLADMVAIGGAMANTFLAASGIDVAKSLVDKDDLGLAKEILKRTRAKTAKQQFVFYIPQDGVVAKKIDTMSVTRIVDWTADVVADIENYPKSPPSSSRQIADDEMILDIGPFTGAFIAGAVQLSKTVVWNGTMGVTETNSLHGPVGPYAHGTELIMEAMLGQFGHRPFSLVGGGDTVGYIEQRKLTDSFDHVSTGGGASLELMAGRKLPGIEALMDKVK
ncbi:MAG TPA: phosphoglycerate kinase [Candidatus Saccharimonadales bacterium]|nr:phosphoglycerate kinase [Candidatus Saccharimonadales bacterium]